jgi:SAM-dependent methyltransferase
MTDSVTDTLRAHHTEGFAQHGAAPRGVDWQNWETMQVHYEKMLAVVEPGHSTYSLLDVGCGFGGLLKHLKSREATCDYMGIDIVPSMIEHARTQFPDARFEVGDILEFQPTRKFDYVVCNGILTQKLDFTIPVFDQFVRRVVRRMFEVADHGIAFNLMTSYVNFTAPNLFYKNPLEMIAFCASELSSKFKVDHAYEYYDYTMYVYKTSKA